MWPTFVLFMILWVMLDEATRSEKQDDSLS